MTLQTVLEKCYNCFGIGSVVDSKGNIKRCKVCGGTGYISKYSYRRAATHK